MMKAVLTTVPMQDETVDRATSSYLDDILVNEDIAPVASGESFAEGMAAGARVLGLAFWGERGELR